MPTNRYDKLRSVLVKARERVGLTQVDLAKALGRPQSFVSKYENGDRSLDVIEFIEIAGAVGMAPSSLIDAIQSPDDSSAQFGETGILGRWKITEADLSKLAEQNPSLRGMLLGYVAEMKLEQFLCAIPGVTHSAKVDDHDRSRKGDRVVTYKDTPISVEVKSLQTNSVRNVGGRWTGKAQVDASDRRDVILPNGSKVNTTCLRSGEFDLLAVNLFAFGGQEWRFVFAKGDDLPKTSFSKYTPMQRKHLLATSVPISWPPERPFVQDPRPLLEALSKRQRGR